MSETHRHHGGCAGMGAAGPFVLQGTERKYARSLPFTVRHLDLRLTLDLAARAVAGVATLELARLAPAARELELDAVGLEVSRVRVDAGRGLQKTSFEHDGDHLRVRLPGTARAPRVEVTYRAVPSRGLYFLSPDAAVPDRPTQVWSQCQDEDARHFVPCLDTPRVKMTTTVTLRVPRGMVALSNGELTSSRTPQNRAEWTYRFAMRDPIPSYLLTVVAGNFAVVEDRPARRGALPPVPVTYYVPPGREADARRALGETPRMVELFGRLTGVPYPYSRYSQIVVSDFVFGGMENATATTLYEHVLIDEQAALDVTSHDLVAHELAHHWFGDSLTCRDWSHAWLNEGFATFFEHVEREDRLGRDEYEYGLRGDLATYLAEASGRYQRPVVCRDYEAPIDLFDRHLYEKGGLVLHLLRRELGDETFWKGVHLYLTRHAGSVVETRDLERAFEEVSGRSLERFFDQWLLRPGHPVVRAQVSWEHGRLEVKVRQSQRGGDVPLFEFPLVVEVGLGSGRVERREKLVSADADALVLPLPERPAWVVVDPDFRILGSVTVEAPADLLREQLQHAPTARGRWLAAAPLGRRHDAPSVAALARALARRAESWMVRAQAAAALGRIRGPRAAEALVEAARDPHPKVRRAVAAALGDLRSSAVVAPLGRLATEDPSVLVSSEAARALGETRHEGALATLVGLLSARSWAEVRRAGALDGLGALRAEAALPHVVECTRYGHPSAVRRAAVGALARLTDGRDARRTLGDLLDDADPHLRMAVVRALESLGDGRVREPLRARLDREPDGRVARRIREALRSIGQGRDAEQRRLSEELESLRRELGELKVRVGAVETRPATPRRRARGGAA